MTDYTPAKDRTIYSGNCSDPDCMTSMAIWPHWESPTDLPDEDDWDSGGIFLNCPVCGSTMDLDFADSMTATIRTGYYPEELEKVDNDG